ncbi:MAG: sugar phosphate isomerase/epimerase family protein [Oscillospiraceae bacterium]
MYQKCKFLIIPKLDEMEESLELAEKYGFGFEYNDFFIPDVMDDEKLTDDIVSRYKAHKLPEYCTMHGAFFDVLIFSSDKKIRKISEERIIQSLEIARKIGARGVVFHTNHTSDLTSEQYVLGWLDRNEEFWRKVLPKYPDLDIYMENMFDRTPDMLCGIAERLSDLPNFGVCFDYAHAVVFGLDIDSWVDAVSPYVKHIHINDNDLESDLHLAVGDGRINWEHFKTCFEGKLSSAKSVLIETSSLENQRRSAEFLTKLGIL